MEYNLYKLLYPKDADFNVKEGRQNRGRPEFRLLFVCRDYCFRAC